MEQPKILVVEDEMIISMDIQNTLESLGYSISGIAATAPEAVSLAQQTQPDLILMDIFLKDGTKGIDAAREIKKTLDVPIVYLTAYSDEDTLQEAKITEPYGYLLKPFEKRELQIVIEVGLYRHKTEMALQKSHQELEKRVEERTAELKQTLKQLEQAVKTRDEFISVASHELKTPLTSMKLQLQNFLKKAEKGNQQDLEPQKLQKMFILNIKQLDRLNRLVDDMLDIARLGSGKLQLQREEVDLALIIKEVVERFRAELENAKITVNLNLEENLTAQCDPFRIDQVISNLISNVIKYAPGKPVDLNLKIKDPSAVIEIKDYGQGISKEMQKKIFQRFERGVSASTISGLGLGLFITGEIVKLHGGKIRVVSEVNNGAKFIIELPLNPERGPL